MEAKKKVYRMNFSDRVPPRSKPIISIAPMIEAATTAAMFKRTLFVSYIVHSESSLLDSSIEWSAFKGRHSLSTGCDC